MIIIIMIIIIIIMIIIIMIIIIVIIIIQNSFHLLPRAARGLARGKKRFYWDALYSLRQAGV